MILWVAAAILIILRLIFGLRLVVERKRRRNVKTIIILGSGQDQASIDTCGDPMNTTLNLFNFPAAAVVQEATLRRCSLSCAPLT